MTEIFHAPHGFGDSIYTRGFVRHFPGSYIETPWPEMYADLGVHCTKPSQSFRVQTENMLASRYTWAQEPAGESKRIFYGSPHLARGSIIQAFREQFGVEPHFDLPPSSKPKAGKPYAVLRPVTVRDEWKNESRNPDPAYIAEAAGILKAKGYTTVALAHANGDERLLGHVEVDHALLRGELSTWECLDLVRNAAVCLGGPGWVVPACVAARTPLFIVYGGCGGHNAPEKILEPKTMDLTRIGWAKPDRFCRCGMMDHACAREITGFGDQFREWLWRTGL